MNADMAVTGTSSWRVIPGTGGLYHISDEGKVRAIIKECRVFNIRHVFGPVYSTVSPFLRPRKMGGIALEVPYIAFENRCNRKDAAVSSLVYAAFHGILQADPEEILHLDGNENNNHLNNLVFAEKKTKGNLLKLFYDVTEQRMLANDSVRRVGSLVTEYNAEGIRLHVHESVRHAFRSSTIPPRIILAQLSAPHIYSGVDKIFKGGYGPYIIETMHDPNSDLKRNAVNSKLAHGLLFQYSAQGNLLMVYNNYQEAAKHYKMSPDRFRDVILKNKFAFGCLWIFDQSSNLV